MHKVLLISANKEHFPSPVFPLSLAYMSGAMESKGFSVRIFDAGRERHPNKMLRDALCSFRPDSVGLSLRNIDNVSYPATRFYVPDYLELVETIRSYNPSRLLLGGSAFSIFPEELIRLLGADAGIVGEGEAETERFRDGAGKTVFHGRAVAPENILFPENIGDVFPRLRDYKTIGIQTARGCPHNCIYCTYPLLEGRRVRPRPPEMVAEEIAFLNRKFSKKDFYVVDSLFNSDEDHMCRVLEAIAAMDLGVSLSCYMKPKVSDPSVFRLLKRAGCIAVDFGTDSGSEELLRSLKKGFHVDDIVNASRACRNAGIEFCHSLLFGAPGENLATIQETVELMDMLNPKAVIAMTGIRLYPGAELTALAQDQGYLEPGQSLLEPCFFFSDMSPTRLVTEVVQKASGRHNWFFPGHRNWSESISPGLLNLIRSKGPLWLRFKSRKELI